MSSENPILISGGGIGGLTAAIALGRAGHRVIVFEKEAEIGTIGYGIQLGPNVFHVFDRLGLSRSVKAASIRPRSIAMLDAKTGEDVARIPAGQRITDTFGQPYVVIHRSDLHEILAENCRATPGVSLQTSTEVVDFTIVDGRVFVELADGSEIEGLALIAADGLRSPVRQRIVGDGDPVPIGYAAHRTIVPMDQVPDGIPKNDVVLWGGPGLHIVHYPLRDHGEFNIVAVFRTPNFADRMTSEQYKAELAAIYADCHPLMLRMIDMMDLERRWPIGDRDPVRRWSTGPVTLMGDAAHATLQSYAQGAGMAIEDALVLAEEVARHGTDFARAFSYFARRRLVRTARVQLESRQLWEFYHLEDEIGVEVRRAQLEGRTEEEYFACLGWLWDDSGMGRSTRYVARTDQARARKESNT